MKSLYSISAHVAQIAQQLPFRNILSHVNWEAQLNVILGLRGVGKTTLLLHQLVQRQIKKQKALYISLDDFYFLDHSLWAVIEQYHKEGGEYLYIDEVHYHPHWDRAVKLAFDRYPRLKITVTGSSSLKLYQSKADLSRRGHFYTMPGLSFREYLLLKHKINLGESHTLDEITNNAIEISQEISKTPGILRYYKEYSTQGYFPFCLNTNINTSRQLKQLVENIVDVDMSIIGSFTINERRQILKFLKYLVSRSPYELNISKVATILGIDRNKVLSHLYALEQADLLHFINQKESKKGNMSKPDKLYLTNSNLYYALDNSNYNIGSMREAFVLNQLHMSEHEVSLHPTADFEIDEKYVFEIGGQNKKRKQISNLEHAYILSDNIEHAYNQYIPIWMMGLLY